MNSKDFLKSKLFDLTAEYPATTIKYYFDAYDNDHFICIHPKEDLDNIIESLYQKERFLTDEQRLRVLLSMYKELVGKI